MGRRRYFSASIPVPRPGASRAGCPRGTAGGRHGRRSRPRTDAFRHGPLGAGRSWVAADAGLLLPGSRCRAPVPLAAAPVAGCSRGPRGRGRAGPHESMNGGGGAAPRPRLPPEPASPSAQRCRRPHWLAGAGTFACGSPIGGAASPAAPAALHLRRRVARTWRRPPAPTPGSARSVPGPRRPPRLLQGARPPGKNWRCARRLRRVNRLEPPVGWIRWKEDNNLDRCVCVSACVRVCVS